MENDFKQCLIQVGRMFKEDYDELSPPNKDRRAPIPVYVNENPESDNAVGVYKLSQIYRVGDSGGSMSSQLHKEFSAELGLSYPMVILDVLMDEMEGKIAQVVAGPRRGTKLCCYPLTEANVACETSLKVIYEALERIYNSNWNRDISDKIRKICKKYNMLKHDEVLDFQ